MRKKDKIKKWIIITAYTVETTPEEDSISSQGADNMGGRMRKVRAIIGVLLACMLLTGCSREWMNYLHTDESLKRIAGRLLEEKYGEEFEIYNVWASSQRYFTATCSPKENPDVVFEGVFAKEGTEIEHDEYVQGIVSEQIKQQLLPEIQRISDSCVVEPMVFYQEGEFENVKEVTIEQYQKTVGKIECYYVIMIDRGQLKTENYMEEYDIFKNLLPTKWNNGFAIELYYVNTETINRANKFFEENCNIDGNYDEIIDGYKDIGFGYKDAKINIAFSEFERLRMEEK